MDEETVSSLVQHFNIPLKEHCFFPFLAVIHPLGNYSAPLAGGAVSTPTFMYLGGRVGGGMVSQVMDKTLFMAT